MLVGHPIFWILVAAVAAPLLAEIPLGFKVPVVVLEVVLGIVIGPHVLGLAILVVITEIAVRAKTMNPDIAAALIGAALLAALLFPTFAGVPLQRIAARGAAASSP